MTLQVSGTKRGTAADGLAVSTRRATPARKKVGVVELIAYTVSSEWLSLAAVKRFKRQFYSVMPQVVSVWCRELGHDVTYASYYGQADPLSLLPDDLDVVFVAASTQASALAYALAKIYRRRGALTVLGGPHAKCFPDDSARFFDIVVKRCDKDVVADIVAGVVDRRSIIDCGRPLTSFPSVEERLPEIATAAFPGGRAGRTSVISLFGSVGCPYTCNFCTDWNSTYVARPADELRRDLAFVAERFPEACLGFQDPNFGVRFDETLAAFEPIPADRRNPYLMQCSLAILNEPRLRRLAETRCLYVAPGIESWSDYGNKLRMKTTSGHDRVVGIADAFTLLRRHVPGLQANFVLGLDSDAGAEPFDLTAEFARRVPFVWPNVNVITPYGGTPVYDAIARAGRLLKGMPLALYCSPYLSLQLANYNALEFYERFTMLLDATVAPFLTAKRLIARDRARLKIARIAQTSAVRHDLAEMHGIMAALRADGRLRAFHDGRDVGLPPLYNRHLDQRLGRYAELLSKADRIPVHAASRLPSPPALERPAA